MNFSTPIPISKSDNPIDYHSEILSVGSCFAVNIAEKFDYFQFRNTVNPFGILFHPVAIENFIRLSVDGKRFDENNIFLHNEGWHCFDAHSGLSHSDKTQMLANLNDAAISAKEKIKTATHIIITLGTAWVYRNMESGNLVANCHKVPQKAFSKELLSTDGISKSLENIISMLTDANPDVNIIFTVSPVRHIKDGFAENQRSKANLISALHEVLEKSVHQNPATNDQRPATNDQQPTTSDQQPTTNDQQPTTNDQRPISSDQNPTTKIQRPTINYFPSYEIMMDELRDYRFYAQDLLHPNQLAIDYIWERFADSWVAPSAKTVMDEVDAVRKRLSHRPFNETSESHQKFVAATKACAEELQKRFAHMKFPDL